MGYVLNGCGEHSDCTFRYVAPPPLDSIDEDDDGPFSVERVRPVFREDVDPDAVDRWEDMTR